MVAALTLRGVEKVFPGGQVAVSGVDLDVQEGELVVLLGPSGCGKSTLLRMVAGIETPTAGRIMIGGQDVTSQPPQERDVAMVFQNYALYPHMSVRENLGFGLKMRGLDAEKTQERVLEVASTLGLTDLLARKPSQLSGGQRQRVALGRAIARKAQVFLLDEPLSNLDVQLRVHTRTELARLHRTLAAPMIYVTHDQEEAMTLGDRVVVMNAGRVLQVGRPMEIYSRPETKFVAQFVGSPRMNLLRAADVPKWLAQDAETWVGIRPEDLEVVSDGPGDLSVRADVVEPLGKEVLLHVIGEGDRSGQRMELRVLIPADRSVSAGDSLGIRFRRDRLHFFDPVTEKRREPVAR